MLFLAVAGCGAPVTVLREPEPAAAQERASPRALLASLEERYDQMRTFRAVAEFRSVSPRGKESVREVVVIERPNKLRIDLLGPFGVALQVATKDDRLDAYHRGDHTHYHGKASVENLTRFTRLPLEIGDLVDVLLLGFPPHRMLREPKVLAFEPAAGRWRLHATVEDGGIQILWFDKERGLALRAEEYNERGALLYFVAFSDFTEIGALTMPQEIEIHVPAREAVLKIRYSEAALNEPVDAAVFSLEHPSSTKSIPLEGARTAVETRARSRSSHPASDGS